MARLPERPGFKRRFMENRHFQDNVTAYILIAPCIILLTIFVTFPLANAIRWSFYNWNFYRDPEFVRFENYRRVLNDSKFYNSILVWLRWIAMVVPARFITAFVLALMLKNLRGSFGSIVKTAVYAPHVTSVVVAAWVFMYIFDYQAGVLNGILGLFGADRMAWLAEVRLALPSEAVVGVWLGFGFETLIMLAGVNDIPETYYEAAIIDGANYLQRTLRITVPMMKNVFLFVLVTSTAGSMQQFQIQHLMTQGGPLNSTTTPNLLIFNHFRDDSTLGYTMAAALLLFIVIASISALLFRVIQSERMSE
jgi:multiple sugar transport system permease protein